jgi:hypothetical protein
LAKGLLHLEVELPDGRTLGIVPQAVQPAADWQKYNFL